MQAAYLQLHEQSTTMITELQSHQVELRAAQEGIVSGRLRHTQEQLEKRHKSRSTVKVPLSGDVTQGDNQKSLAAKEVRRQKAAKKASAKAAKVSREQPLIDKLIAAGSLTIGAPLTVQVLRNHLKSLNLTSSGKRDEIVQRLSDHYGIARPDTVEEGEQDDEAEDGDDENTENQHTNLDEEKEDAEQEQDGRIESDLSAQALKEEEERLKAESAPNEEEIAAVLAETEEWIKEYWKTHYEAAKLAYKARKARKEVEG